MTNWVSIALLLFTASAQFTECPACLNDGTKKYCVGPTGNMCCDLTDLETPGCNDSENGVRCSNTLEKTEQTDNAQIPPSDTPNFYNYLICPQDPSVCGKIDQYYLKKPSSRAVVTDLGIDLKAEIPQGYLCTYKINITQDSTIHSQNLLQSLGLTVSGDWMTEFQIDDVHTHSNQFKAHLIYADRGSQPIKLIDYDILATECSAIVNSCTHNVQEKGRNFYLSERQTDNLKLNQLYLVLLNSGEGDQVANFSGNFQRVPSNGNMWLFIWSSALWVLISTVSIFLAAHISASLTRRLQGKSFEIDASKCEL